MSEQTINKTPDILADTDEFMKNLSDEEKRYLRLMRLALLERDKSNRSFWRAVFNALQSGAAQAGAELKRLFKE